MKKTIIMAMVLGFAASSSYVFAQDDMAPTQPADPFTSLDANQDGNLSPEEVQGLQGIGDRFSELDIDGNGSLQPSELAAALQP
ncbi:MAG: hypothetical protein GXP14_04345 [Gammaproteobacteria bacterium]|nr:hypothetical protein [Gammaproteobacteria bacterium]